MKKYLAERVLRVSHKGQITEDIFKVLEPEISRVYGMIFLELMNIMR